MDKIIDYLKQLDLSEVEAKLYLTLLKSGPTTVRDLAQTVDIKRTTAYFYIDQLMEKSLIMKLVQGSKKLVAANEPENLETLVETKIVSARSVQQSFPTILERLKDSSSKEITLGNAEIKYSKGVLNVRKIYEEAFSGNEFRSYVKVEEAAKLSSNNPSLFQEAIQNNKKLNVWEIIYDSPYSRRQTIKTLSVVNNRYHFKFMPNNLKWSITSEDILMYDGKVAIVDYKGTVSSIVLQSPDFYHNFKEMFDFIWRIIPETKI